MVGKLVVFYVPLTARSFKDGTPHLLSLAKDTKLGFYCDIMIVIMNHII